MTLTQITQVLLHVAYPGYSFSVKEAGDRFWLQAVFIASCSESGAVRVQHTRKWYVSREATPSEVVQTALKCVLTSVEHEAREQFTYRGRAIFGPHLQVERLFELFDRGAPIARREVEVAAHG